MSKTNIILIGIFAYILFFVFGIFSSLDDFRIVAALIVGCIILAAIPILVLGYVHLMCLFIPDDRRSYE